MTDVRTTNQKNIGTAPDHNYTYLVDGVDIVYDATQPNGSAVVGRAVTLSGNRTVRLAGDAQAILGQLIAVEPDGTCAVKEIGTVELPAGTAAAITAGSRICGALLVAARGYIRNVAPATLAEVAIGRHTIIDAATSTAVLVALGR